MPQVTKILKHAVHNETQATLLVLNEIIELERTETYKEHGFTSLYLMLTEHCKYSEGAAMRRLRAARVMAKLPTARTLFIERKVSLCTLSAIATKVLKEGQDELLSQIIDKSKREVESLLAVTTGGGGTVRETIKPVRPVRKRKATVRGGGALFSGVSNSTPRLKPEIEPRFSIHFSVTKAGRDLVDEARTALSNQFPKGASLEELFTEGLKSILKDRAKKTISLGSRKSRSENIDTRTATAKVKSQVLKRDNYCCSYVYQDGTRCCSDWQIEVDHIRPYALGGKTTPDNLRVLCRAHNQYLGKQVRR